MPGRRTNLQRVITSSRLIVPIAYSGESIDERAVRFKSSVLESINQARLNPDVAVKAMPSTAYGNTGQTYEDTDNQKREFSADSRPGVEDDGWGHRVEVAKKWEPGSILVLSPSRASMDSLSTLPNMGWITPEPPTYNAVEGMISQRAQAPSIRLTIYDVDPRTDDIIQESARVVDPFAPMTGMTSGERQKNLKKYFKQSSEIEEKALGRALKDRVPGGSLITRVAAAFGVLRDARNKFRCPPGTPAANQFTDAYGSNCFGISPSRFARFAARQAARMEAEGEFSGLRDRADKLFRFFYNNDWDVRYDAIPWDLYPNVDKSAIFEAEDLDPAIFGREPHYDALTGERVPSPEWLRVSLPADQLAFKNGMVNAQATVRRNRSEVESLAMNLGVDTSDASKRTNADLVGTLNRLRELGLWDVQLANVNGGSRDTGRLSESEVKDYVTARLRSIPGWLALPQDQKDALIAGDTARYYESERGFLNGLLTQFIKNPEAARMLGRIEYDFSTNDEAGTGFYGGGLRGGPVRAVVHVNLERILSNQESMLPDLRANQRLAIAAVGARTEAEAQAAVADFLYQSEQYNKVLAGQIDGPGSFSEFIGHHEFAHVYQGKAVIDEVKRQIDANGFIEVPVFNKKNQLLGMRAVRSIEELTGADVMQLMQASNDAVDHDTLNGALDKIKNVQMLSGRYGKEHREGSELWALEASAELFATREMGLIWGEDVDAALAHMDDAIARPSRVATAQGQIDDATADSASTSNTTPTGLPNITGPLEDQTLEDLTALADNREQLARQRIGPERQGRMRQVREDIKSLDETDLIETAAWWEMMQELNADAAEMSANREVDPSIDQDRAVQIKRIYDADAEMQRADSEFYETARDAAKKEWRKRFGIGARGESQRFDDMVADVRRDKNWLSAQQQQMLALEMELDDIRERAKSMPNKELVDEIVATQRSLQTLQAGSDDAFKTAAVIEALKAQYVENQQRNGDKRGATRIMRDLEEQIEEVISPRPKPPKKFKSADDARAFAKSERARLRSKITKTEASAIKEVGDFESASIIQMFAPEKQTAAGRAMNARNARLKRNGLTPDEKLADEGSLTDQVEHILFPVMEAIDASSVSEKFEIEAIVEINPDKTRGNATGRLIDVPTFTTGSMLRRGSKDTQIRPSEARNKSTGKTRRRVIITVNAGDRGLFPSSKDGEQKFVLPPGSIRITGRDTDGTLRADISSQMDTVEVADSLVESLSQGYDDRIWRDGAAKRVRAVADRLILQMRSDGRLSGPRDAEGESIGQTNASIHGEIADTGSSFGEAISSIDDLPPVGNADPERLSSGRDGASPTFNTAVTRQDRRTARNMQVSSAMSEMRGIAGGRGSRKFPTLARDSIDPRVLELIMNKSDDELIDIMERAAYKMHAGFDRRVRVRARQEDLDYLASTGGIRSNLATPTMDVMQSQSRRLNRLANMSPQDREQRLSSGIGTTLLNAWNDLNAADPDNLQLSQDIMQQAMLLSSAQAAPLEAALRDVASRIGRRIRRNRESGRRLSSGAIFSSSQLEERAQREQNVSEKALSIFDKIVNNGAVLTEMSDGQITELFDGRVKRTGRRAVGVNETMHEVYKVDNTETALALMMLGHHVEVDSENLELTKQAQKQFEKMVQNSAVEKIDNGHADWIRFRDQFSRENPSIDVTSAAGIEEARRQYKEKHQIDLCMLYDPETNLLCSGAIGIQRGDMPQVNGRTLGHEAPAIRALKAGKAAGKWEPLGKLTRDDALIEQYREQINKKMQKAEAKNKPITEEQALYDIISSAHNLRTEYSRKSSDNKASYDALTPEAKQWLYDNTNWQNVEVNLEMPFVDFLNKTIKTEDGGAAVVTKRVDGSKYAPSQQQLVASKVDSMNEDMTRDVINLVEKMEEEGWRRSAPEFREEFQRRLFERDEKGEAVYWWTNPILVTKDGYILDGHHRWGGLTVANAALDEDLQVPLQVFEVQTDIVEGLTLGKVFQRQWGIKDALLGVETPWVKGDISDMSDDEVLATASDLVESAGERVDDMYDSGHFIKLGSVGLKQNKDYASSVSDRQALARSRRPSPAARQREREINDMLRLEYEQQSRSRTTAPSPDARNNDKIVDASLRRANLTGQDKDDIRFALGAIDGIQDMEEEIDAEAFAEAIQERVGAQIAQLSLAELKRRGVIGERQESSAMERLSSGGTNERVTNAFNQAVNALNRDGATRKPANISDTSRSSGRLARAKRKTFSSPNRNIDDGLPVENSINAGKATNRLLREYNASIGLSENLNDDLFPVNGYLVHRSQLAAKQRAVRNSQTGNANLNAIFELNDEDVIGDGLTAFGDIEIVLKPQVSNRTAYGRSDGIMSGNKPVKLNSTNKDDIVDAFIGNPGRRSETQNMEAMMHLLGSSIDGDFTKVNAAFDDNGRMIGSSGGTNTPSRRTPFEAQILGGFDMDEVEQINFPVSKLSQAAKDEDIKDVVNERSIADRLRKSGFSEEEIEYFYSISGPSAINTESMGLLRQYRAASKVRNGLRDRGFAKVKFAHRDGIDIDDPRSYSKGADLADDVESVLKDRIMQEIRMSAEKIIKQMRNGSRPSIIGRSGARL